MRLDCRTLGSGLSMLTNEVPTGRSVWRSHNKVDAGHQRELYLLAEIHWSIWSL